MSAVPGGRRPRPIGSPFVTGGRCAALLALVSACIGAFGASPVRATGAPALTLSAPPQVHSGQAVTLTGRVSGAPPGTLISLYARPYTATFRQLLATLSTDAQGGFRDLTRPDRTTAYIAQASAGGRALTASATVGVLAIARPLEYAVFFKGGWRSTGLGQLVHQIGGLERPGRPFAMAVMTDGDPSMSYGIDTIQGVTQVLLR